MGNIIEELSMVKNYMRDGEKWLKLILAAIVELIKTNFILYYAILRSAQDVLDNSLVVNVNYHNYSRLFRLI